MSSEGQWKWLRDGASLLQGQTESWVWSEDGARLYLVVPSKRTEGNVMWDPWEWGRTPSLCEWPRSCRVSLAGFVQEPSGLSCSLGWPCLTREVGPEDPQWSLPTSPVLWDSVILWLYLVFCQFTRDELQKYIKASGLMLTEPGKHTLAKEDVAGFVTKVSIYWNIFAVNKDYCCALFEQKSNGNRSPKPEVLSWFIEACLNIFYCICHVALLLIMLLAVLSYLFAKNTKPLSLKHSITQQISIIAPFYRHGNKEGKASFSRLGAHVFSASVELTMQ